MNIHHYNPFAFDGRGIAVVLDPGHRARSVRLGDRGFERHGNLDKGREVWVSYGRPGAYGQLYIDGQGYAVPASRDIVYGSSIRPIQAAQEPQRPTQERTSTASPVAPRNPLLPAAAAVSPLLTEGGRGKVADWLDSGFTSLRNIGEMFSPTPSTATMTGGGIGSGTIGAINAAAPWAIGGTAVLTALRGILGESAEERFIPMMEQYMAGSPRTLAEMPRGGSARNSYASPIPSANNVFENAAAVSKRSGKPVPTKPTVGDYGVFTSNDKPFVKVPGDSPMLDSLRRGDIKASGVSTQPGGTALAANTYARVKNAFDWRERVKQEEQRGGK